MKKNWMLLIGLFGIATIGCADDKPIAFEQTPVAAQQFIKTHFPQAKVLYAKVDQDVFDRTYDVVMADGSQVEFNKNGEWTEVDCLQVAVPAAIVPQQIKTWVASQYAGQQIVSISRDKRGYDIKLSNRFEVEFDQNFQLIDLDVD